MLERIIPSTKKSLPVIGLGTSRVFDIKPTTELLAIRQNILDILLDNGGTLIDTSPMYGKAEEIIGRLIETYDRKKELFLATKVWARGKSEGEHQIKESFSKYEIESALPSNPFLIILTLLKATIFLSL